MEELMQCGNQWNEQQKIIGSSRGSHVRINRESQETTTKGFPCSN